MREIEPKVCIILVNYNNYSDTVDCVKSILNIEYTNYEIIIVDNSSSESKLIINDPFLLENSIVIQSEKNNGFSAGNNIGILYAKKKLKPDYYLLLNNDTVVDKYFLINIVKCAKKNNDNAVVGGKIYYYKEDKTIWYAGGDYNTSSGFAVHYGYNEMDNGKFDNNENVGFITGCLMLIPEAVISSVGLLNEEYFLYSEDIDYCCRVKQHGFKLIYCSNSVIYHKVSAAVGENSPTQQYYMLRNDLYIISKYGTNKVIAYLKRINDTKKKIVLKKMKLSTALKAYIDFILKIKGRVY